ALVGEAHLDGTEAAHGTAGRVVGPGADPVDRHGIAPVGANGEVAGVGQHSAGGRCVGAAVEEDLGFHSDEPAVGVRLVAIPHAGGMTVDVARERLVPVIHHLDGPTGVQRQQAQVDVQIHVLAGTDSSADADRVSANLVTPQA